MLSRSERRRLREIERWFEENDPRFAASVRNPPPDPVTRTRRRVAMSVSALGVLVFFLGLLAFSPLVIFIGIALGVGGLAVRYLLLDTRP
ncbi:DUF3040 domain-containing protein [Saccharopolyspora flava]|uniref:DUF3040 domain-containing protein n=1 Tax=Saccharopolyspora flava TaxID=95161 RepID=A0A1I6NU31_9PSEU|nr:DUF3040 domain-containing protein [Saccharopolyspora flava]SFS31457.1 Protein of unknown function [Saccharopolyspora flava]